MIVITNKLTPEKLPTILTPTITNDIIELINGATKTEKLIIVFEY